MERVAEPPRILAKRRCRPQEVDVDNDQVQWLCETCGRWWECDEGAETQVCGECGTPER